MELRAVLFDLDDTLHDKAATLRVAASTQFACEQLARHGIDEQAWQHAYLALNKLHIEKTEVFSRLGKQFRFSPELESRLLQNYEDVIGKSVRAHRGAFVLLNECKSRNLKVGIVTNGGDALQRKKIAGLGIGHLVDSLVTSGGFGVKKPDHRIFHQCLSELAVEAGNAVFVGDSFAADMAPALALGMQTVWKSKAESPEVSFAGDRLCDIQAFLFSDDPHTQPALFRRLPDRQIGRHDFLRQQAGCKKCIGDALLFD